MVVMDGRTKPCPGECVYMYTYMYGPETPLAGNYILSIISSLPLANTACTATASVHTCWAVVHAVQLVMWVRFMASVYARWQAHPHSRAVCAVNVCTEVEPVYSVCTTAFHMCCSQS